MTVSSAPVLSPLSALPDLIVNRLVADALAEDWGRNGDVTSQAVIPETAQASAVIRLRNAGHARAVSVLAGLDLVEATFHATDPGLQMVRHFDDGAKLQAGDGITTITGPARGLLSGERVALNFLGHLSGIATHTAQLVDLVAHTRTRICDTRKTTPGLRVAEKFAVRAGGGTNHRFGLDDAILIKDNHIAVAGGIKPALRAAQAAASHVLPIEIEVDTIAQLEEALDWGAKIILLDNMSPATLKQAVVLVDGRAVTEASGSVSADTVVSIAEAGVDYISIGAITHSSPCLDLGLDVNIS